MARHLKTNSKCENRNPPESACVKGSEDMNRIRMAFNHHSEKHTSFNPRKFKDPIANQVMTGVREAEYLIRTGRTLQ